MTRTLHMSLCNADGRGREVAVPVDQVLLVGYSGRNRELVAEHIRELERLGVTPPASVPAIFTVAPELLTDQSTMTVGTLETSGEAEFFLLDSADGWLVGVGSDHTDRAHEAVDVAASKSLCGKVVSRDVWHLDEVQGHWDALELRAWATDGHGRRLYQDGRLQTLLDPPELMAEVERAGYDTVRRLIFGGTLPTIGGVVFGGRFEAELHDPILDRKLRCAYDVVVNTLTA